jgi:hypothetical protein
MALGARAVRLRARLSGYALIGGLREGARTEGLPDDEISATENPPGATRRGAGGGRVAVIRCCVLTCTDVHRVEQTRGGSRRVARRETPLGRVFPDDAHCDRYYSFKPRTRGANGTSGVSDWESRTERSGHRPGNPTLRSGTLFLRSVTLFHGERTAIRALTK